MPRKYLLTYLTPIYTQHDTRESYTRPAVTRHDSTITTRTDRDYVLAQQAKAGPRPAPSTIQQSVRNAHVMGSHDGQAAKYARICAGCQTTLIVQIRHASKVSN